MHIALAVFVIILAIKYVDRKNWDQYHPTMFYMFSMAMTFEYLTRQYTLWEFHTDVPMPNTILVLLYAVIIMPLSVLVFLSRYPGHPSPTKRIIHYLIWIGIYMTVEVIESIFGRITYLHGWNLGWSLVFDIVMFPMLRLHHKNPLLAYPLSILISTIYMFVFKVSLG